MAILLVYTTSGVISRKKVCHPKMAAILKILKYLTQLQFDFRYETTCHIMPKIFVFRGDEVIDDATGWTQSCPLYSCLGELGARNKLQGQSLVNKCEYHNRRSRLYMPNDDLNEYHFSRSHVKGHRQRLTGWPWHSNGRNSVNLWIIEMKQKRKGKK